MWSGKLPVLVFLCTAVFVVSVRAGPAIVDLGALRLHICHERIIRVLYDAPGQKADALNTNIVNAKWDTPVPYSLTNSSSTITVATAALRVTVDRSSSSMAVAFADAVTGAPILQETGRDFEATTDLGAKSFTVQQSWASDNSELVYGGGELQNGLVQYRGAPLNLAQFNGEAVVPFFVSASRGFGLLWNSVALTRLNPATEEVVFSSNLTNSTLFTTTTAGRYWFRVLISSNMYQFGQDYQYKYWWGIRLTLTPRSGSGDAEAATVVVIDFPPNMNKPAEIVGRADLPANTQYALLYIHNNDGKEQLPARLFVSRPVATAPQLTVWSALGDGVDYYFMYGAGPNPQNTQNLPRTTPAAPRPINRRSSSASSSSSSPSPSPSPLPSRHHHHQKKQKKEQMPKEQLGAPALTGYDAVIALYREATGAAPMYAQWAFGFWQCQERYHNQSELLADAHAYRDRQVPLDNIVQDWHYWGNLGWGPQWDPAFYPDPAGMVQEVHGLHLQIMVSTWSKYDVNTKFFTLLNAQHALIPGSSYIDIYNPAAQSLYYQFAYDAHFSIGVDALWLDASEPEGFPNYNQLVNNGTQSGTRVWNPYPLLVTEAVQKGQNRDYAQRRVFTLTRSSFAGMQRTGAAVWSGDIDSNWDELQRQVAASINYQLTGLPYWTQDLGGFNRPGNQYTSPDFHELLVRWFQFGVFTPLMRVHGGGSETAIWKFGSDTFQLLLPLVQFRYRLLPYVYTMASWVTRFAYTMQRALIMDFAEDAAAVAELADEYMFGPAFLVAPVYTAKATERTVYVPKTGTNWYSFFDGSVLSRGGGEDISVPAVSPHYAVLVRAGSLIPLGPYVQYTSEKPADPLELRIYPGADGRFTLYEDDGMTRAAEFNSTFAEIDFVWSDASTTLSIGARRGSFDGMVKTRTLHLVVVAAGHGVDIAPTPDDQVDSIVTYTGAAVTVTF